MKPNLASIPLPTRVLVVLGSVLALLLLAYLAYRLRRFWRGLDQLDLKDRFAVKNDFIKTAAQILGGAFFLFGLYFTWSNLVTTQEKNITDLYTKAIGQLGSDKLEVRLGGIYALERIARDSEKDHGPIMEVLTAYIRENAPWPPEPFAEAREKRPWAKPKVQETSPPEKGEIEKREPINIKPDPDIQAVLTVIGRRVRTYKKGEDLRLDLTKTDLRGADLSDVHFEGAVLHIANLKKAHLSGTRLDEANLSYAYLERANLYKAQLKKADLYKTNLVGASLGEAHLDEANLRYARLEGTNLRDADLEKADLRDAHLEGSTLWGAHLQRADLRRAHLERTEGLTQKQLAGAFTDKNTVLPFYFQEPQPEKRESK